MTKKADIVKKTSCINPDATEAEVHLRTEIIGNIKKVQQRNTRRAIEIARKMIKKRAGEIEAEAEVTSEGSISRKANDDCIPFFN